MLIRFARADDAAACAAIYRPFVDGSAVSFELDAPGAEVVAGRIEKLWPSHPWIIAEEDGVVLGYAYGAPYRERKAYQWAVEVTVYLAPEARGKGLGRKLYEVLLNVLSRQGFTKAYGVVTLPNPASAALHEAVGFRPFAVYRDIGFKNGAWHDVGWWECDLASKMTPQPEPVLLTELGYLAGAEV
ncbi:MAG: GNAT family N-acetyltransferase [Ponticaulis sp.]|nr:GNAT family N-acetyltransferase [Ponticaulis sp.]|tara:strand:- start:234 stop:791 length:558 start_codon:yes stop_codon:yes gene_type:complete